jgi:hypothetical protein
MDKNQILSQMGRAPLFGGLAVNQVQITGKPFAELATNVDDLYRQLSVYADTTPKACEPATARPAVIGDVAIFGGDVAVGDLICPITFEGSGTIFNGLQDRVLPIIGWFVSTKFTNNAVSSNFELRMRYYLSTAPASIYNELNFDPIITPTGGANSASEYIIWAIQPSSTFAYDVTTGFYSAPNVQRQGFLKALPFANGLGATNQNLGIVETCALIFKDQAATTQQVTVTPLLATAETESLITTVLARNFAASNSNGALAGSRV